jgi:hypothetical protein
MMADTRVPYRRRRLRARPLLVAAGAVLLASSGCGLNGVRPNPGTAVQDLSASSGDVPDLSVPADLKTRGD